jgi:AraC-like DNA-binding protein
MHAYFIALLIEFLGERGFQSSELFHETGLSEESIKLPGGLPADQLDSLFARAIELVGDPQLGLTLGGRINIISQGIFGYALMSSATSHDSIKLLIRYSRALVPSLRLSFGITDGRAWIRAEGENIPRALARFYIELVFAAIVYNGHILLAHGKPNTVKVNLDYWPEGDVSVWHSTFGSDVNFDAIDCSLSFAEASLATPITTANPIAGDIFRRECDRLISRSQFGGSVHERVQQCLLQSGSEFSVAEVVARKLNMSESTLQRRLKQEGWRFQQLLDEVRHTLAREYLEATNLPVAEISLLLGFSDAPNFRRSFRRWSGTTPQGFRDRVRCV